MADLIDELVEHPARTVRLMAVGEVPDSKRTRQAGARKDAGGAQRLRGGGRVVSSDA
jgi:hypothetical protein